MESTAALPTHRGLALTDLLRIVHLADTHLGFDYPLRPRVSRRWRGPDFFDNYHRVLRHAIDTRADLVVHGGDLFFRSRVPGRIVDLAYEPLVDCASRGIPVVIVPGNHERSLLPSSLQLNHPGIHVFDRPRTFRLDVAGVTVALSGFPFERHDVRGGFPRLVRETGWESRDADVRFLCLHQAVEGAQVGPSNYTFRRGQDVIRMADLPTGLHAVLAGHIHRRQILTGPGAPAGALGGRAPAGALGGRAPAGALGGRAPAGREDNGGAPPGHATPPVLYPGSIERTSFAEKDEPKGFFELTMRRRAGRWELEPPVFLPLPARPMVDLYVDPAASDLEGALRASASSLDPDSVVRLRAHGEVPDAVRAVLSTRFLRRVFPESMNVQCGRELAPFDPARRRRPYRGGESAREGLEVRSADDEPQGARDDRPERPASPRDLIRAVEEQVPAAPGVYRFHDEGGRPLYIGKSIHLRRRMLDHLRPGRDDAHARRMASEIASFTYAETGTELLALLLEDQLIKREHPRHNTRQREYRECRYLAMTDVDYPNLRIVEASEHVGRGTIFGPFRDRYFAEDLKRIAEDVLRLRACPELQPARKSPRFDLGQCSGPCRGRVTTDDYGRIVERVRAFLAGETDDAVAALTEAMAAAAADRKYEHAAELRERIDFCRRFGERQRFLDAFREGTVTIRDRADGRTYVFEQGRLTSGDDEAATDGDPRAPAVLQAADDGPEDPRFLLDRGNVVYGWIRRASCSVHVARSPRPAGEVFEHPPEKTRAPSANTP